MKNYDCEIYGPTAAKLAAEALARALAAAEAAAKTDAAEAAAASRSCERNPACDGGGSSGGGNTVTPPQKPQTPPTTVDPASHLDFTGYEPWEIDVLKYLYLNGGPDAQHGVEYMLANGIHIVLVSSVAGGRGGRFDSGHVYVVADQSSILQDTWALQNIIHEALHIEQGAAAYTWEGERLAWQAGLRVLLALEHKQQFASGTREANVMNANNAYTFAWNLLRDNPSYAWPMVIFYPPCNFCL